jgi:hypothetical protein
LRLIADRIERDPNSSHALELSDLRNIAAALAAESPEPERGGASLYDQAPTTEKVEHDPAFGEHHRTGPEPRKADPEEVRRTYPHVEEEA